MQINSWDAANETAEEEVESSKDSFTEDLP
jgi:hypothetical protein